MGDRQSAINLFNQAAQIPIPPPYNGAPQLKYQLYSSAALADPTMGVALYEVANANRDMSLHHAAIALYRKLLDLPVGTNPGDADQAIRARAMVNLGHCLYTIGQPEEAEQHTMAALAIDLNLSLGWCNLSLIDSVLGRLDASLEHARHAHALEPQNPVIETALAFAYLYKQDFATGLRHFEARFPYRMQQFLSYPYPKWQGEEGKVLYLVSEQGIGDALSFARFIELAARRSRFINIVVQKELARLFKLAFQHLDNINIMGSPQPFFPAEYWTTPMSLPTALGLTNDEIINAPHIKVPKLWNNPGWKNQDAKFHIGVAWSGSPAADINHWRSFPVTQLLELYRVPGIQLYCLQTNDQTKQLHDAGCATLIRDLSPNLIDVVETLAVMNHLDLVVTTESAPGHIASLAQRECWIPYSFFGRDWRCSADGSRPIWSPKHKFFRQGRDASWPPVFSRIVDELMEKVHGLG